MKWPLSLSLSLPLPLAIKACVYIYIYIYIFKSINIVFFFFKTTSSLGCLEDYLENGWWLPRIAALIVLALLYAKFVMPAVLFFASKSVELMLVRQGAEEAGDVSGRGLHI